MISPSEIISQRQMMLPYSGCSLMSVLRSSMESVSGRKIPFLVLIKSVFSFKESMEQICVATSSPIAGAEESPGDSIPATLKNPFASSVSPMTKSSPSSWARSPAKEVIT